MSLSQTRSKKDGKVSSVGSSTKPDRLVISSSSIETKVAPSGCVDRGTGSNIKEVEDSAASGRGFTVVAQPERGGGEMGGGRGGGTWTGTAPFGLAGCPSEGTIPHESGR